jgi:galactokinase
LVQAPARLELMGSHAEWNGGLALSVAMDRHLCLASAPRTDGKIELVSSAYPDRETVWLSDLSPNFNSPWTTMVKAVLGQLRARGVHFGGFNAVVHSEIPPGAGFGSSGALLAATALTVRQLYPHKLTETGAVVRRLGGGRMPVLTKLDRLRTVAVCRSAGQGVVGETGGSLDVVSTLCGREFHAVLADAQLNTVEVLPLIGEMAVVVCDTGRLSPIVEAESAALRYHCQQAAQKLNVKYLRAVESPQLKLARDRLSARQHAVAYHVASENQRIVAAERALRAGDLEQFGQYLLHSHDSARQFFGNTGSALDLLVELARAHRGCLGARASGLGFGGYTVNLVLWNEVEAFCASVADAFAQSTGKQLKTMRCRVVDGAKVL